MTEEKISLAHEARLSKKDVRRAVEILLDGIRVFNASALLAFSKMKSVSNKLSKFITLRRNGELMGFLMYRVENDVCFLYELHVSKDFQSQGHGSRLVTWLLKDVASSAYALCVHIKNERAQQFYKRHGFRVDSTYDSREYFRMLRR